MSTTKEPDERPGSDTDRVAAPDVAAPDVAAPDVAAEQAEQQPEQAEQQPEQAESAAALAPGPRRQGPHRRQLALIGVLLAALGFAIAVQVRANSSGDGLSNLSSSDLLTILDNQNTRADKLRRQIAELQATLDRLRSAGDSSSAAAAQAKAELQALQILLGVIPATGPGISVEIADPGHKLDAEQLLDVVEELRGAGAEAIEFGGVRIGTNSAFTDGVGTVVVDGHELKAPYRVLAIGDPATMRTALLIPGGVSETLEALGGTVTITEQKTVTITAVRALPDTSEVRPSGH